MYCLVPACMDATQSTTGFQDDTVTYSLEDVICSCTCQSSVIHFSSIQFGKSSVASCTACSTELD